MAGPNATTTTDRPSPVTADSPSTIAGSERYLIDKDVLTYLVHRTTDLVEERARMREHAWRGILAFLLLGLGWLGWDRVANFEDELKDDLGRLERSLEGKIQAISSNVEHARDEARESVALRAQAAEAKLTSDLGRRIEDGLRHGSEQYSQVVASQSKSVAEASVRDLRDDLLYPAKMQLRGRSLVR